jgi:hypothetical protein
MDLNKILSLTPDEFAAAKREIIHTPKRQTKAKLDSAEVRKRRYGMLTNDNLQPLILIDLDNTIMHFEWPGIAKYDVFDFGQPLEGSQELCRELAKIATLEVTTTRMLLTEFTTRPPDTGNGQLDLSREIKKWLTDNDFPLNMGVSLQRKPFCVAYIGNEAFGLQPNLETVKLLCDNYRRLK